ncbi:hypothetical protein [Metabacillus sp. 84]|uniref:hypothetical protein n=1 Tax=Metabacillus sp. 84 TaxID=3404705 RepID=UPI003CF129B5
MSLVQIIHVKIYERSVLFAGGVFSESEMSTSGAGVFWASTFAFILAFTSWKWRKISGALLIVISIYRFFANGLFFTLAFLFLMNAGLMAVFSKQNQNIKSNIQE